MKLRVRLQKTTRVLTIDESNSKRTTVSEVRLAVSQLYSDILEGLLFDLSLNNKDTIEDESQAVQDIGIVSGDLIYIVCPELTESTAPQQSPLQSMSGVSRSVHSGGSSDMKTVSQSVESSHKAEGCSGLDTGQHSLNRKPVQGPSHGAEGSGSSTTVDVEAEESDVDMNVVRRHLSEPALCREASHGSVPATLVQLYTSAQPQDRHQALAVILHVLTLETGFIPQDTSDVSLMPSTWKCPGCFKFQYTYPQCEGIICSIIAVPAASTLIVHGQVETEEEDDVETHSCSLTTNKFVAAVGHDAGSTYCNLAKLSMVFKDRVVLPLLQDVRTAAGYGLTVGLSGATQEVKLKILSFLNVTSTVTISEVSREFKALARDPYIWRRHYLKDFGNRQDNSLSQDWLQLYINQYKQRKERRKMLKHMTMIVPPTFPQWGPGLPQAPSPWIPPGPGMIGGDYDLNLTLPGMPGGIGGFRHGVPGPPLPRPRFDPIGPLPDHVTFPGRGGGPRDRRPGNPFGGGIFPKFF